MMQQRNEVEAQRQEERKQADQKRKQANQQRAAQGGTSSNTHTHTPLLQNSVHPCLGRDSAPNQIVTAFSIYQLTDRYCLTYVGRA